MIKVEFLGPIGKENLEVEVSTLSELGEILSKDDEISEWLSKCAIAVNDEIVFNKDRELQSGDKISLLPPVCGG